MRTRLFVEQPAEIEMTLKITMPLKDWEVLRDQLVSTWPSWKLSGAITDMLSQARKVFYPSEPEEPV